MEKEELNTLSDELFSFLEKVQIYQGIVERVDKKESKGEIEKIKDEDGTVVWEFEEEEV